MPHSYCIIYAAAVFTWPKFPADALSTIFQNKPVSWRFRCTGIDARIAYVDFVLSTIFPNYTYYFQRLYFQSAITTGGHIRLLPLYQLINKEIHIFLPMPHLYTVAATLSRNTHETEEHSQRILSAD